MSYDNSQIQQLQSDISTLATNLSNLRTSKIDAVNAIEVDLGDIGIANGVLTLGAASPTDPNQAVTKAYVDALNGNTSQFAAVAVTGEYSDLLNKPTIPTNNNQLTNGAGYATVAYVDGQIANVDFSDYSNTAQMEIAIDTSNTAMRVYVDAQIANVDFSDYSNTAEMQIAIDSSNTLMKTYVDGEISTVLANTYNYTDTAIADLVDSAPVTLDTLNELAAALGDDANFSTTVTNALGLRLRVDTAAQGLTATQKSNALTNLGISGSTTFDGTFAGLSSKTSGTGEYSTSGNLTSGRGSGGVSLTINDGYGNANITWNHKSGVPEQDGNAARIEVNTDSTSGAAMYFELKSNVSSGTAVNLTNGMTLTEGNLNVNGTVTATGGNSTNWNTAYGWGDHASAGYLTSASTQSKYLRSDVNDQMLAQLSGGFGSVTTSGTTDWNDSTNARSGGGYTLLLGTATNGPGGSTYYHPFSFEYSNKDGTGNMTQFAIPYNGTNLFFRYRYSSTWNAWTTVWTSGNFSSTDISNWNTAYGWGDHSTAGYLTSSTGQAAGNYVTTDTTQDITGIKEFQDNVELRFGNGADARIEWDNPNSRLVTRVFTHGGYMRFQAENTAGTNRNVLSLSGDTGVTMYHDATGEVSGTKSTGMYSTGLDIAANSSSSIGTRANSLSVLTSGPSSPIACKTSTYDTVCSVLPWSNGISYLNSGIYYDDGTWVHASDNAYNCLFEISGLNGTRWYASSNSTGSWNLASAVPLWNNSGQWTGDINTTYQTEFKNIVVIDHNASPLLQLKPTNGSPWALDIARDDLGSSRVFTHNPGSGRGWVFEDVPYFYGSGSYYIPWHSGNDDTFKQAYARNQGWNPAYSNSDEASVYYDFSERAVAIHSTGDTTIGAAYKAMRVEAGEQLRFHVQIKGNVASTAGLYVRIYYYTGDLPNGKTHVSNSASHTLVQEDSGGDSGWYENGAITTSYVSFNRTWTAPTTGYVSLVILNWSGHSTNKLFVKDAAISKILSSSPISGFLPTSGGTLTGDLTIDGGGHTNLVVDGNGGSSYYQNIHVGESATGSAALHLQYRGDGYAWIGMGDTSSGTALMAYPALQMFYQSNDLTILGDVTLNTIAEAPQEWNPVLLEDGGIVKKDSSVQIHGAGYLRAAYLNMSHASSTRSSDTVFFSSTDDYIRKNNKAGMQSSLGIGGGAAYVDVATGNYGTVKVDDDRGVTWAGYAIRDDWVFMSNGAAGSGIYDDTDNVWMTRWYRGGATELYWDGAAKAATTSTGFAITGNLTTTGSIQPSGIIITKGNASAFTGANDTTLSVRSSGTSTAASMSFHRPGAYAMNLGLDTDNHFKLGGWSASTVKHTWQNNGTYLATGDIYAYYSDERLKTKHGKIKNAIEKINSIETFYYTHNEKAKELGFEDDERMHVGVSAQTVEKVMPEVVALAPVDNNGSGVSISGEDYKTVQYEKLVPLLIEAIKELKAEIEELKK